MIGIHTGSIRAHGCDPDDIHAKVRCAYKNLLQTNAGKTDVVLDGAFPHPQTAVRID
jgi:hypothetical protein